MSTQVDHDDIALEIIKKKAVNKQTTAMALFVVIEIAVKKSIIPAIPNEMTPVKRRPNFNPIFLINQSDTSPPANALIAPAAKIKEVLIAVSFSEKCNPSWM